MRIYTVRDKHTGAVESYVRANTLVGAIRAVAETLFTAMPATTDEIYLATKSGKFDVIDAVTPSV
jgi:hypothetical protein